MAMNNYGKDITNIKGKIRFHLPNGETKTFKNSKSALEWFDLNTPNMYMLDYTVPGDNLYDSGQLPEVVVMAPKPHKEELPKDPILLIGDFINNEILLNKNNLRARLYSKAMESDPEFSRNWDMASNISEHYNALTGGLLNRLSPTLNIRLAYDLYKNNDVFKYGNSWWGNSGIIPNSFMKEHPLLSFIINGAIDHGLYKGANNFYKWGTTPRVIGEGAEARVVTSKFSPHVTKYTTISPSEMDIRNQVPRFLKTTYKGTTPEGLYVYKQPKAFIPKNPINSFRRLSLVLAKNHYFPFEHPNMEGRGFLNLPKNLVLSDFGKTGSGLIGRTWYGKPVMIDMAVEPINDFMIAMEKKGGKLNGET